MTKNGYKVGNTGESEAGNVALSYSTSISVCQTSFIPCIFSN